MRKYMMTALILTASIASIGRHFGEDSAPEGFRQTVPEETVDNLIKF